MDQPGNHVINVHAMFTSPSIRVYLHTIYTILLYLRSRFSFLYGGEKLNTHAAIAALFCTSNVFISLPHCLSILCYSILVPS